MIYSLDLFGELGELRVGEVTQKGKHLILGHSHILEPYNPHDRDSQEAAHNIWKP